MSHSGKEFDYFNYEVEQSHKEEVKIASDTKLFFHILKYIVIYILLFIPNVIMFFLGFFSSKIDKKKYFKKIFIAPIHIFLEIKKWILQAKNTSMIIFVLFIVYMFEILYLGPKDMMNIFMTYQTDIFTSRIYTVFTSIFMHANLLHIAMNSIALLIFGRIVERHMKKNIIWVFILSGVISNIVSNYISYLQGDFFYSLGASGAIAGIIILAILLSPFTFTSILVIPMPICVIGWGIMFIDFIGIAKESTTNHLSHLGGYFSILIFLFFLEYRHKQQIFVGLILNIIFIICLLFIANITDVSYATEYLKSIFQI